MLEFDYSPNDDIPGLAYLLHVVAGKATVTHGTRLDTHGQFFTDGAWAGDFSAGRFDETFFCGTGCRISAEGLTLVSASTPLERLLVVRIGRDLMASNSLPFLLTMLDDSLDEDWLFYRSLFTASGISFRHAPRSFKTKKGRDVRILLGETAEVGSAGTISATRRPLNRDFRDFHDYRSTLAGTTAAVVRNAQSELRVTRYEPLVSLSGGYDSAAVAVWMSDAGGRRAVTLLRREGAELVDYPGPIADALGLELHGVERDTWRDRIDFPDAEIACAGTGFLDIPFLALETELLGALLFVGHPGGNVWQRDGYRLHRDIWRGNDTCGQGLSEYRLRVGFVQCPIPYMGATAGYSLTRISNSAEMGPWRIGGHYDRPIPRRIIEEAGVERGTFATRKYAGGARIYSDADRRASGTAAQMQADLQRFMTMQGAASFAAYCADGHAHRHHLKMRAANAATWTYHKLDAFDYRFGRALRSFGIKGLLPRRFMTWVGWRFVVRSDYTSLLPHWGTSLIKARYKPALEKEREEAGPSTAEGPLADAQPGKLLNDASRPSGTTTKGKPN